MMDAAEQSYNDRIRAYMLKRIDINHETGCFEWQFNSDDPACKYGSIRYKGEKQTTHRVAWIVEIGEIPEDNSRHGTLHVLHKCDNPKCINTDHLFLGTHQDNIKDRDAKGRGVGGINYRKNK